MKKIFFNISDPGDSWWLKIEKNSLSVLFKLSHTENVAGLIKLGPLGAPEKSQEILDQLYGYFKMMFPIEDYSSAHYKWTISCAEEDNLNFNFLRELFVSGEPHYDFWEFLRNLEYNSQDKPFLDSLQKANYFLMELAAIRNFWKVIEEKL